MRLLSLETMKERAQSQYLSTVSMLTLFSLRVRVPIREDFNCGPAFDNHLPKIVSVYFGQENAYNQRENSRQRLHAVSRVKDIESFQYEQFHNNTALISSL